MQILIDCIDCPWRGNLWKDAGLLIPPFPECIWGESSRGVTWPCTTCEPGTYWLYMLLDLYETCEPGTYWLYMLLDLYITCEPGTYELHMLLEFCITYKKA